MVEVVPHRIEPNNSSYPHTVFEERLLRRLEAIAAERAPIHTEAFAARRAGDRRTAKALQQRIDVLDAERAAVWRALQQFKSPTISEIA